MGREEVDPGDIHPKNVLVDLSEIKTLKSRTPNPRGGEGRRDEKGNLWISSGDSLQEKAPHSSSRNRRAPALTTTL